MTAAVHRDRAIRESLDNRGTPFLGNSQVFAMATNRLLPA